MRFLSLLFLLLLSACASPINIGPDLAKTSQQFSEALRWQDYHGASNFLLPEVRSAFLDQFQEDQDLHIVESRIVSIDLNQEAGTAEVEYQLEYFRLPSSTVKKWRWTQKWLFQKEKVARPGIWLIENTPPDGP